MKKIDIEFYRNAKADFIANLKRREVKKSPSKEEAGREWEKLNNELSLYCACFGLPVIVAITFCEEEFTEYAKELEKKREIVQEFYDYE